MMVSPLNFEFAVQSLEEPELSKDTKTKIRRQAMKAAVRARKQSTQGVERALSQRVDQFRQRR